MTPSESFQILSVGSAVKDAPPPATPRNVPHRGGDENPSAAALKKQFGDAVLRSTVVWGQTTVYIAREKAGEIIRWLHDDSSQQYDYLVDVTAIEYREAELPMEVVWHLRSLPYRRFLRVKTEIPKGSPLSVDSVWHVYRGADWLERECYDMFGIEFVGHPDLRRLLMWEQYKEGYPLRKDFPLRGRFSRSEQLRQALAANPESRYSMEELSVAEAFSEIPDDMRRRLASGERTGE